MLEQAFRGLLANARHSLDVVDRIASQREEVRNLLRPDTKRVRNLVVAQLSLAREIPEHIVFRK